MAVISSRTADMPGLFREVIEAGVANIYLEKPGASTVAELEDMLELAKVETSLFAIAIKSHKKSLIVMLH